MGSTAGGSHGPTIPSRVWIKPVGDGRRIERAQAAEAAQAAKAAEASQAAKPAKAAKAA